MANASSATESRHITSNSSNVSSNSRYDQLVRPASPHTPMRPMGLSFTASSPPAASFRGEGDAVIFELGSRWLRAGFEGDNAPTCVLGFGPEEARRVGDYRGWISGNSHMEISPQHLVKTSDWDSAYELWRMDLRNVDLRLIEDKIERVFRDTYNKYLLADAGASRLILVLPSVMPHPLLSSVLSTLFSRWRFPSITLLPSAAMSTVAAGVRSALVVDLGWAETTVTAIYEHREMIVRRSTRAMKTLLREKGKLLTRLVSENGREPLSGDEIAVSFEFCEEIVSRLAWCRRNATSSFSKERPFESADEFNEPSWLHSVLHKTISIPSPSNPSTYIDIPFSTFTESVEKILLGDGIEERELDDEEKPVPLLVYSTLLSLPPDARGICMSRIIFVGGGAKIPGLRRRIFNELSVLVKERGWNPVRGEAIKRQSERLRDMDLRGQQQDATQQEVIGSTAIRSPQPSNEGEEEIDLIEQKFQRNNKDKTNPPPVQGILREIESLGAWAGASLVASLKVRGMVEIDREKFLQHGLAGVGRDLDSPSRVPDRWSGLRPGGDLSSWTLSGWAS